MTINSRERTSQQGTAGRLQEDTSGRRLEMAGASPFGTPFLAGIAGSVTA